MRAGGTGEVQGHSRGRGEGLSAEILLLCNLKQLPDFPEPRAVGRSASQDGSKYFKQRELKSQSTLAVY